MHASTQREPQRQQPMLAPAWDFDGTNITFTLRKFAPSDLHDRPNVRQASFGQAMFSCGSIPVLTDTSLPLGQIDVAATIAAATLKHFARQGKAVAVPADEIADLWHRAYRARRAAILVEAAR